MKTKKANRLVLLVVMALLLSSLLNGGKAEGSASDSRFQGAYCGTTSIPVEVPMCILFICWKDEESFDLKINAQLNYIEPKAGQGLVTGRGVAQAGSHIDRRIQDLYNIAPGKKFPFVVSGKVISLGSLRGSGRAAGIGTGYTNASLSEDGETLQMEAFDFGEISLSKANCGNQRPTATITHPPSDHTTFEYGELNLLHGRGEDREDDQRNLMMIWTSDNDPTWTYKGYGKTSAIIQGLSTGTHTITLEVVDSGGRRAVDQRTIIISNEPPEAPVILSPLSGAEFTVGQCVPFRGEARDVEDGNLTGRSLEWSTSQDPGGILGTGTTFICNYPECYLQEGRHTITLTAKDSAGRSRSSSLPIKINSRAGSNSIASVWIERPLNFHTMSARNVFEQDGVEVNEPSKLILQAEFCDIEDEVLSDDRFEWIIKRLDTGEMMTVEPGKFTTFIPDPIADPAASTITSDTRFELKVKVTDNDGGTKTSEPVYVIVIPDIGLY